MVIKNLLEFIYAKNRNLQLEIRFLERTYNSDKAKLNYLKEYSQHYNTVEVDQWFWSLFEGSPIKMPD